MQAEELRAPITDRAAGAAGGPGARAGLRVRRWDSTRLLAFQVALWAIAGFATTAVWGLTDGTYYWPAWVWLGFAIPVALHVGIRWAWARPPGFPRRIAVQAAVSAVLLGTEIAAWALAGQGGTFWPIYSGTGYLILLALHAAIWGRMSPERESALSERIDQLTRTRRGALDVQAAELRRIERDLHDGAQARLVALSMQLGRLDVEGAAPGAGELVDARREHGLALRRDPAPDRGVKREQHQVAGPGVDRPEGPAAAGDHPGRDLAAPQHGGDRGLHGDPALEAPGLRPRPAQRDVQRDRDPEPEPHPRGPVEPAAGHPPDHGGREPGDRRDRDLERQQAGRVDAAPADRDRGRAPGGAGGPLGDRRAELISLHCHPPSPPARSRSRRRPAHHPSRASRPDAG